MDCDQLHVVTYVWNKMMCMEAIWKSSVVENRNVDNSSNLQQMRLFNGWGGSTPRSQNNWDGIWKYAYRLPVLGRSHRPNRALLLHRELDHTIHRIHSAWNVVFVDVAPKRKQNQQSG